MEKRINFSILITTKNRVTELALTLNKIQKLLGVDKVHFIVFDDGSSDGTFAFVKQYHPTITVYRNEVSKGLIYCRNKMLTETTADYTISLDDDAHFLTENPLETITDYFAENASCGLIAFRIFWGLQNPALIGTNEKVQPVKGFVGCAHVWKMEAWKTIPNYPEWFVFYGEEDFASYHLFKNDWEIHYVPQILVHHRVDIKSRKKAADYSLRLRRSLRSGWYLMFMFYPIKNIPRTFIYSLWMQTKNKIFKGDYKATVGILAALMDLVLNFPKIIKNSNRLSVTEYERYKKLGDTKLYWHPENEK